MSQPKAKQITVEVESSPPRQSVYANFFSIEQDGAHVIFHFGVRTNLCDVAESSAASMSVADIRNQQATFGKYIQDLSLVVDSSEQRPHNKPRLYTPKAIEAANIMQLARTGGTAETTFSHFVIHDLVAPKKSQQDQPLKAVPKLLIRSDLRMQYDMICEVMELIRSDA